MLIFVPSGYSMSSGELFSASFAWSMQLQTVSFCICSYSCLTITALSNPSSNIVVQGYRVHPRLNLHFFVSCSSYRTLISEKRLEYHFYLAILKMKGTITGFLSVSLPPIFSFNPFFNYNKHDLQCKSDHVSSLQKKPFTTLHPCGIKATALWSGPSLPFLFHLFSSSPLILSIIAYLISFTYSNSPWSLLPPGMRCTLLCLEYSSPDTDHSIYFLTLNNPSALSIILMSCHFYCLLRHEG